MRIYIISDMGRASVYGIGSYVNEIANVMYSVGYHVGIVKIYNGEKICKEIQTNGVEIISIPNPGRISDYEYYYRNVTLILRALIYEEEEQYIFQLNHYSQSRMIEPLRRYFNDCLISFTIHFFSWGFTLSGNDIALKRILNGEEENESWSIDFINSIKKSFDSEQRMLEKADSVICLCQYAKRMLEQFYSVDSSRVSVIYNGLSDGRCNLQGLSKVVLKKKYHLLSEEKVILFAGRMDDIKGVTLIIKAYCKLKEIYPLCHLIIAGDGDFQGRMEDADEWIREITFTGRLSKQKLYEFYSMADIGIMQSFHEQCSYVGIEMMMHGLPIIGTNSTGLDEMIIDGETGLKLPVIEIDNRISVDVDLLKDKMLLLIQNDSLRNIMGLKARKRYETSYSIDVMAGEMEKIYQRKRV